MELPFHSRHASEVLAGMHHTAKVGCIHLVKPKTQPGWDLKVGEPAEVELEMARAWLYDRDLLKDHNSKELPLEWALCRFWALSKCHFGDTVDEAAQCTFLHHLLPWEDKLAAVQMDIRWVWDPKYHYHLDLTNAMPIWVEPPHLHP